MAKETEPVTPAADPAPPPGPPPAPPPDPDKTDNSIDPLAEAMKMSEEWEFTDGHEKPKKSKDPEPETPAEEAAPAAPEPEKEPETGDDRRISERLADLTRTERQVREERARLRDERAQLAADLEKAKQFDQREQQIAAALREDPIGTLGKFGVDILDVLQQVGGDGTAQQKPDRMVEKLEQRIAQLEGTIAEGRERAKQRAAERQEQDAYRALLGMAKSVVEADPEKYELTLERGDEGLHDVFLAVNAMFEERSRIDGVKTPVSQREFELAAEIVEEAHRQKELQELERKGAAKRLQGRLTFGSPTTTAAKQATAPSTPRQPATLKNDLTRTPPARREPETDEERLAEAFKIPHPFEGRSS